MMKPDELRQIADSFIESKYSDVITKIYADMEICAKQGDYSINIMDYFDTTKETYLIGLYFEHKGFEFNPMAISVFINW